MHATVGKVSTKRLVADKSSATVGKAEVVQQPLAIKISVETSSASSNLRAPSVKSAGSSEAGPLAEKKALKKLRKF